MTVLLRDNEFLISNSKAPDTMLYLELGLNYLSGILELITE